jgi:DNA replication protein
MKQFAGFPPGKTRLTPIPAQFFSELLPEIDHLGELKVTLYSIWFVDRQEGETRYISYEDFWADQAFVSGLRTSGSDPKIALTDALARAVERGNLLLALRPGEPPEQALYFLNTVRGRATLKAWQEGKWQPDLETHLSAGLKDERPSIYKLYEENIGPLTPMIADELRDAEATYPADWIADAMHAAVVNNARTWAYVLAILRKWQERGRDDTYQRDAPKTGRKGRKSRKGEFDDFIER